MLSLMTWRVHPGCCREDVSVVIHHFGIQLGLDIGSAVCNGSIGGIQFQIGYAMGDAAEGEGLCTSEKIWPLLSSPSISVVKPKFCR